ncbi:DUF1816 domain-containing protein [bacterium]|nr:DUF1816 domain-containing protein [Candidatus Elulimicrobium humile]
MTIKIKTSYPNCIYYFGECDLYHYSFDYTKNTKSICRGFD